MTNNFSFEMRLTLSKRFPPTVSEFAFGQYTLRAIPSDSDMGGEAVLCFTNTYEAAGGGSHPEEEAAHVSRLISLLTDTRVKRSGIRVNAIDIPSSHSQKAYPQFLGKIDPSTLADDLKSLQALDEDIARQFLRACHSYSFALEFIPSDITFSFFLLVLAIECLSSQDTVIPHTELHLDAKKCERFCRFIGHFLPQDIRKDDERNTDLLTELSKTVYYAHRSGFVHGGKEVSSAAFMADRAGSSYFKHELNGKETKTPGLGWFAKVVRGALLGFLRTHTKKASGPDGQLLARIAYEKAGLKIKAKKDIKKGQVVTFDDVEYR